MKTFLFCLALLLTGAARADELADANALFAKQAYPQALQLYTRLAGAGNAEAQRHLAEMYWYGEAGAIDNAKADAWFRKAAAQGDKESVAALEVMRQRELRRADLDYWIAQYDGADLKAGKFACKRPDIPAVSKTNSEIKDVSAAVADWQRCYNGFVAHLNDALPPGKRIPAELSRLLNEKEYDAAVAHLDQLYARLSADESAAATATLAAYAAWRQATESYAAKANQLAADREQAAQLQWEQAQRQNERATMGFNPPVPPVLASKKQ